MILVCVQVLIDLLGKNPAVAVPIVLSRLIAKEAEWWVLSRYTGSGIALAPGLLSLSQSSCMRLPDLQEEGEGRDDACVAQDL